MSDDLFDALILGCAWMLAGLVSAFLVLAIGALL